MAVELRPQEVHLWARSLVAVEGMTDELALLDDTERSRAARFRAERDRIRFVAHHAFVRRVLARYLDMTAAAIAIRAGSHGKPEIHDSQGLSFNASRSGDLGVVAVATRPVGVDIERLRPIDDALELAEGLFGVRERHDLRAIASGSRSQAFLELWTRKEAVVKAFGTGLSQPLDAFDLSDTARVESGRWQGQLGTEPFVVVRLDTPPSWLGAVSVIGEHLSVRHMDAASLVP
jgi:4'-phosphopantetheinyl transferase